jgi:hypothetical protein
VELISMRNSTTYFTALTRCIHIVCQQGGSQVVEAAAAGGTVARAQFSRHNVPTSDVGLAGTQLSSSINRTVAFVLTFFNEVTKSTSTSHTVVL